MAVAAASWKDHEELVKWTVWKIVKKYGGDFEETYSEALLLYVEAVQLYDESRGSSLSSWVGFRLYKELQETKRNTARRLGYTGAWLNIDKTSVTHKESWLDGLVKLLSVEAQEALFVILELNNVYHNKSLFKLKARRKLREKGYKNESITSCFEEIEAALT